MHVCTLDGAEAFVTLDGSTIRELAGRVSHGNDDAVLTGG